MYRLYYSPIDEESRIVIPIDILVNLKYQWEYISISHDRCLEKVKLSAKTSELI
jgi:hypothetical protein